MVNVMEGINSDSFISYKENTVKAFLITRRNFKNIIEIIKLSEKSGLKCFNQFSIENFYKRFFFDKTEYECALEIYKIIDNAYNNHRTIIYDKIQYIQNKIVH